MDRLKLYKNSWIILLVLLRESLFDQVVIRTSLYVHDSCVGRYSSPRGPLMTDRMSVSLVTEVGPWRLIFKMNYLCLCSLLLLFFHWLLCWICHWRISLRSVTLQVGHRDFDVEKKLRRDLKRTHALLADAQLLLATVDSAGQGVPNGSKEQIERLHCQVQWVSLYHRFTQMCYA